VLDQYENTTSAHYTEIEDIPSVFEVSVAESYNLYDSLYYENSREYIVDCLSSVDSLLTHVSPFEGQNQCIKQNTQ